MKLGIISDTHGYIDQRILHHLENCDLIWHAGDIGSTAVVDKLNEVAPTQGVYGNIDDHIIRARYPEIVTEKISGLKISMIHIAGAIEKYNAKTRQLIVNEQPDVLICGHSHILKVKRDQRFGLMHINPGAAGNHGFHKIRTLLRLEIEQGKLINLEAVELGTRSTKSVY